MTASSKFNACIQPLMVPVIATFNLLHYNTIANETEIKSGVWLACRCEISTEGGSSNTRIIISYFLSHFNSTMLFLLSYLNRQRTVPTDRTLPNNANTLSEEIKNYSSRSSTFPIFCRFSYEVYIFRKTFSRNILNFS